jgi:hypothetical protein
MPRPKLTSFYLLSIGLVGISFLVITTVLQAPNDIRAPGARELVTRVLILFVLTFLSSLAPLRTRQGIIVSVGLAPLFGALLSLPPWALMWVAAIGTLDERIPGKTVPWTRFIFSRGMFSLVYGIPSLAFYALGLEQQQPAWVVALPLVVLLIVGLNDFFVAGFLTIHQGANFWRTAANAAAGSWLTYIA